MARAHASYRSLMHSGLTARARLIFTIPTGCTTRNYCGTALDSVTLWAF